MSSDNDKELHHMLGVIQSDVRHVLTSINSIQSRMDGVEKRVTAIEKFNVRVITLASFVGIAVAAFISGTVRQLFG